jgi:RNA polymerase sigma factor (sigma-70 family)
VSATAERRETDRTPVVDLSALFERHVHELLRYCACRVGAEAAEDVVADTFLIAYRRWDSFDPARASPLTWLYGIATRVAHRHRRAESRRLALYARSATSDVQDGFAEASAARADAQRAHKRIAAALAQLSSRQRDVVLLFAVAELEYSEIADALNIPMGTVQSSLHRARAKMRAALGDAPPPEGQP